MRPLLAAAIGMTLGVMLASNPTPEPAITSLNHIAIRVADFDRAADFYSNTMGFPEAFRLKDADGNLQFAYFQVNRSTFVELMPADAVHPVGLDHFGLEATDMAGLIGHLSDAGVNATGPIVSPRTGSHLGFVHDPDSTFFELLEFVPGSAHRKAIDSWSGQ